MKSTSDNKMIARTNVVTQDFVANIKSIVEQGLHTAYASVNQAMIDTYWNIGRSIVEEEQKGVDRAAYGKAIINKLSQELTLSFGSGYSPRYLRAFRQFYQTVPDVEIWKSRFPNLTWTHILAQGGFSVDSPHRLTKYPSTTERMSWKSVTFASWQRNIPHSTTRH